MDRGGRYFSSGLGSGSFTSSPASSIACVHTSSSLPLMIAFWHENRELSNWVVPGSASAARSGSSGVVESTAASRAAAQAGALGLGGGRRILWAYSRVGSRALATRARMAWTPLGGTLEGDK